MSLEAIAILIIGVFLILLSSIVAMCQIFNEKLESIEDTIYYIHLYNKEINEFEDQEKQSN